MVLYFFEMKKWEKTIENLVNSYIGSRLNMAVSFVFIDKHNFNKTLKSIKHIQRSCEVIYKNNIKR